MQRTATEETEKSLQKETKVRSLASQKATTCSPLAIVAEGRSATFSSRALHTRITSRISSDSPA